MMSVPGTNETQYPPTRFTWSHVVITHILAAFLTLPFFSFIVNLSPLIPTTVTVDYGSAGLKKKKNTGIC